MAPLKNPIAASWMYLSDVDASAGEKYAPVPAFWQMKEFKDIYKKVDVLFVGPLGLQANGEFGLYNGTKLGPMEPRFKEVVTSAKAQNPNIKIFASQFWNGDKHDLTKTKDVWGYDLRNLPDTTDAINTYAKSVKTFVETWDIDGYDIDYEYPSIFPHIGKVLKAIHGQFKDIETTERKRYVSICAASVDHLEHVANDVDLFCMMAYGNGYDMDPADLIAKPMNLKPEQLVYGICAENSKQASKNVEEVKTIYQNGASPLRGIFVYRLNSGNWNGTPGPIDEDDITRGKGEHWCMKQIYDFLNPPSAH